MDEDDEEGDIRSRGSSVELADVPDWQLVQRRVKRPLRDAEEDEEDMGMEDPDDEVRDALDALPTKFSRSDRRPDQVEYVLFDRLARAHEGDAVGADGDVVPSRRKRLLLIVWQRTGDGTARTRWPSLTQEQEEVSGMGRVGACREHMRALGAHAIQPLLNGNARSDETKKVQADTRNEDARRTKGQSKRQRTSREKEEGQHG